MNRIFQKILFIVLTIVFFVYGITIDMINSGSKFYFIWFFISLSCFLMFIFNVKNLKSKLGKKLKIFIKIFTCLFFVIFLVAEGFIVSGFFKNENEDMDYVIVLGAQVKEEGPSSILKRRLDKAIEYLNEHPKTICVVTGGKGANEPFSEAEGMYNYLVENGIDGSRIIKEDKSTSTIENLSNAKDIIGSNVKIAVVTNNFHVFRAICIAEKIGFSYVGGISAGLSFMSLPNNMLREFFALLAFVIK